MQYIDIQHITTWRKSHYETQGSSYFAQYAISRPMANRGAPLAGFYILAKSHPFIFFVHEFNSDTQIELEVHLRDSPVGAFGTPALPLSLLNAT